KDGYTFAGWRVTELYYTKLYDGKIIEGNTFKSLTAEAYSEVSGKGQVLIEAIWTDNEVKVTFVEGLTGSTVSINITQYSITIGDKYGTYNVSVNAPVVITTLTPVSGFHFVKWVEVTEAAGEIDITTDLGLNYTFTSNTTVKAIFEADLYTVQFGAIARYPESGIDGAFAHNGADNGLILEDGSTVTLNKWFVSNIEALYQVSISTTGEYSNSGNNYTISYLSDATFTITNVKNGYHYLGWSYFDTYNTVVGTTVNPTINTGAYEVEDINEDKTVYLYFEANNYNLTVDYGSGSWIEDGVISVENYKIFNGLISGVVYNIFDLIGDAYLEGYKPVGLDSELKYYASDDDYNNNKPKFVYNVDTNEGIYFDYGSVDAIVAKADYTEEIRMFVDWQIVNIWVSATNSEGNEFMNFAELEVGKFIRYHDTLENAMLMVKNNASLNNVLIEIITNDESKLILTNSSSITLVNSKLAIRSFINPMILEHEESDGYRNISIQGWTINIDESSTFIVERNVYTDDRGDTFYGDITFNLQSQVNFINVNGGEFDFVGVIDGSSIPTSPADSTNYVINITTGSTVSIKNSTIKNINNGAGIIYTQNEVLIEDTDFEDNSVTNITIEEEIAE
ncbi:MAG: hypothetical protein IKA31_02530, partial [Clostridia bacterium]|nr:hypothetical protein [Clostridia bacterium]